MCTTVGQRALAEAWSAAEGTPSERSEEESAECGQRGAEREAGGHPVGGVAVVVAVVASAGAASGHAVCRAVVHCAAFRHHHCEAWPLRLRLRLRLILHVHHLRRRAAPCCGRRRRRRRRRCPYTVFYSSVQCALFRFHSYAHRDPPRQLSGFMHACHVELEIRRLTWHC